MPRTMLSRRTSDTIELHLGKVLIFCEGHTENHYFSYFQKRIKNKYDDIIIKMETVNANSQSVLNYADRFLNDDENQKAYYNYEKHLVFDCDDPSNILEVIEAAEKSEHHYHLLISSLRFEVWLLMHLEELEPVAISKKQINEKLEAHLSLEPNSYKSHKDDAGLIAKIIKEHGNVDNAIVNADALRSYYDAHHLEIGAIISGKYPYSTVGDLVKQLAKATE